MSPSKHFPSSRPPRPSLPAIKMKAAPIYSIRGTFCTDEAAHKIWKCKQTNNFELECESMYHRNSRQDLEFFIHSSISSEQVKAEKTLKRSKVKTDLMQVWGF